MDLRHDVVMGLQITVRGSAQQRHAPERAILRMAVVVEGEDRAIVVDEAAAVQEPLADQLRSLADRGAVAAWSSDQVQVYSRRPWNGGVESSSVVHTARLHVTAEFADVERLSGFLGHWSALEGVEVVGLDWDVTGENRRRYEADVRKAAVDDAVVKAQAYADAVGRGRVTAVELADPGMLEGEGAAVPPVPMTLARSAAPGEGAGPALEPEEIVIGVEVDARFQAE